MAPFPLDVQRLGQIEHAVSTPIDALEQIWSEFAEPNRRDIKTISDLQKYLSDKMGVEHPKDLSGFLIFIQNLTIRGIVELEAIVDFIDDGIEEWDIPEQFLENWNSKKNIISKISLTPTIKYISKRTELYHRHRYHLHDFRILAEIRPVLDEERTDISEFICFNELHVVYSSPGESESYLEIAVGVDELERMKSEIDIALSKQIVIQEKLGASTDQRISVYRKRSRQ